MNVVLVHPQIASNTGSVVRLCANVGARLHLVEPLGFTLDDAALKRGGLDYHELASTTCWPSWDACRAGVGTSSRWYATTAHASRRYDTVEYQADDVIVFGREADGLSQLVLSTFDDDHRLAIPMQPGNRSINLSNAVSIVVYEAARQRGFPNMNASSTFEETRPPR